MEQQRVRALFASPNDAPEQQESEKAQDSMDDLRSDSSSPRLTSTSEEESPVGSPECDNRHQSLSEESPKSPSLSTGSTTSSDDHRHLDYSEDWPSEDDDQHWQGRPSDHTGPRYEVVCVIRQVPVWCLHQFCGVFMENHTTPSYYFTEGQAISRAEDRGLEVATFCSDNALSDIIVIADLKYSALMIITEGIVEVLEVTNLDYPRSWKPVVARQERRMAFNSCHLFWNFEPSDELLRPDLYGYTLELQGEKGFRDVFEWYGDLHYKIEDLRF